MALAEVGYWMLELLLYEVGAPCGRGLTFFYSAVGLALRAVLRTFTSRCSVWFATSSRSEVNVGSADGPKGEAAGRIKESKQRKGDDGVGSSRCVDAVQRRSVTAVIDASFRAEC